MTGVLSKRRSPEPYQEDIFRDIVEVWCHGAPICKGATRLFSL
jgi:hypothetical protein